MCWLWQRSPVVVVVQSSFVVDADNVVVALVVAVVPWLTRHVRTVAPAVVVDDDGNAVVVALVPCG